jgi:hypothetical protein
MDFAYPGFGSIEIDGVRFDHDIVIDAGEVRARDKGPSRTQRSRHGHTPLTAGEAIPWSGPRLVIGTGASGRLPITPGVWERAESQNIEVVALPTAEAVQLLDGSDADDVFAVLHVTC